MEEKKFENISANEKKGRCVYAAAVAREFIRRGFAVIDIKPNKENHDKTVFVFEETENFNAVFEDILNAYSVRRAQRTENRRLNELTRRTFL